MKRHSELLLVHFTCYLSLGLMGFSAHSAEIDQFTGAHIKVADSALFIDEKVNFYIQKAVAEANAKSTTCDEKLLYKRTKKYLNNHMMGQIMDDIDQDPRIQTKPVGLGNSIYKDFSMLDGFIIARPGAKKSKLALSREIRFGQYDIGLDKIEHIFALGHSYFDSYRFENKDVFSILKDGEFSERIIYGGNILETGVFSYGDLTANFNGMRFWNDLLKKKPDPLNRELSPVLSCENNQWVIKRQVTLADYIDDGMNEAINCSVYLSEGARETVRKALSNFNMTCPMDPQRLENVKTKYRNINAQVINTKPEELFSKNHPFEGWAPVPEQVLQATANSFSALEYSTKKSYLREFRFKKATGNEYGYASWEDIKLKPDVSNAQKMCWFTFITGGDCKKPVPRADDYLVGGELDLLQYARTVSRENGLFAAREVLKQKLENYSLESSALMARIIQATKDKNLEFPDSLSQIPQNERSQTALFMILGIGGDDSANAILMRKASEVTRQMGFHSEMLNVDANLGSDHNAKLLASMMKERLPRFKRVGFVVASKGAADLITYMLNYASEISQADREKFRIVASMNGVIRSSYVAQYLISASRPTAFAVRSMLRFTGKGSMLDGISSLAQNIWQGHQPLELHQNYPRLKWISFASIPESDFAVTNLSLWSGPLQNPVYNWANRASPGDGLVETAASLLPPGTGLTQYVIPVYGPHEMALGKYSDGTSVAPIAQGSVGKRIVPASGVEMLNAMLRAIPQDLID